MKFLIVTDAAQKHKEIRLLEQELLTRLRPHSNVELLERHSQLARRAKLDKNAWRKPGDFVAALDENGVKLSSSQFAALINKLMNQGSKRMVFLIGGPDGHSKETLENADQTISLSAMTFTSEMARLLLIEQLYRAFSIIRGFTYHRS